MELETGYYILVDNCNSWSTDECAAWVDWNQDMDFYDAGEYFYLTGVGGGVDQFEGTITPPADALGGETVMRVRVVDTSIDPLDPCGSTSYGEVEDYCINVLAEPAITYLVEPYPIYVLYKYAIDPMDGYVYLSNDAVGGDVNDLVVTHLDIGGCVVPTWDPQILPGGYGELAGPVLRVTFNVTEYIECQEALLGPIFDEIESFFDVVYELDGVPGSMEGQVTMIGHVSGDLNLDGTVNVADVTYFVEWLFFGGPAPVVLELADVNGSGGNPNVGDLSYLVDFLFNNGPAPVQQKHEKKLLTTKKSHCN
jgi:hypothetical protein